MRGVDWSIHDRLSRNDTDFPTRRAAEEFVRAQFTVKQQASLLLCRHDAREDAVVRDLGLHPLLPLLIYERRRKATAAAVNDLSGL